MYLVPHCTNEESEVKVKGFKCFSQDGSSWDQEESGYLPGSKAHNYGTISN
jgi:hypothetical protein